MKGITTHVLDLTRGAPADGIDVVLWFEAETGWIELGTDTTDADGRAGNLHPPARDLQEGRYRLVFATGEYFEARQTATFYPHVEITFQVGAAREHYHVPLLLSPHGYSTYRGS